MPLPGKRAVSNCSRGNLMSYNDRSVQRKQPKTGNFRQYRNPGQNTSPGSGPSGHLMLKACSVLSEKDEHETGKIVLHCLLPMSGAKMLIVFQNNILSLT